MIESIFFWTAVTAYAVAVALFFINVSFKKEWSRKWAIYLTIAGLIPHAISLILRWIEVGHGPYSSRYEVLSANAFIIVLIFVVVTIFKKDLASVGIFVLPAAFFLMGWAVNTFGLKYDVPIIFKSYWLILHIGFAKVFGATVLVAASCAVGYILKRIGSRFFGKLPEAEILEQYSYKFLLLSFLFLSIMIAAGSLWAYQSWGRYWAWDPIETSSFVTWLVIGLVLHFKVLHRWSGLKMAYLTLFAFVCSIGMLYVVTLVVPTIHNSYLVGK